MNDPKLIDVQETRYWVDGKPFTTEIRKYSDGWSYRTEFEGHGVEWTPHPLDMLGDCGQDTDIPTP